MLWADVPESQRADEAFFRSLNGASDELWLEWRLRLLRRPYCQMAVTWPGVDMYAPCAARGELRDGFCSTHRFTVMRERGALPEIAKYRVTVELTEGQYARLRDGRYVPELKLAARRAVQNGDVKRVGL